MSAIPLPKAVNSQSVINAKLVSSNKVMDQVVVIMHGTASKRFDRIHCKSGW
jgi:hypothetical protein